MRRLVIIGLLVFILLSCSNEGDDRLESKKILYLAHSIGTNLFEQGDISGWFDSYNKDHGTKYKISHRYFPKARPYGWENYPYDYWKIWVKEEGYKLEPSLKRLASKYDIIVWKHCSPGSFLEEDPVNPTVDDRRKSVAVYKLQYEALKKAMSKYPDTQFIVWTLAVMLEDDLTDDQRQRTKEFVDWVRNEWDEPGDNIHIWDFYKYETTSRDGKEHSLFLRPEYKTEDAHPNKFFNVVTAPYLCERIVDVISGKD